MNKPTDPTASGNHWYQQPIAWLGIAVFLGLLGGCIWTVTISLRYTDVHTHGDSATLLGLPVPASNGSTGQP